MSNRQINILYCLTNDNYLSTLVSVQSVIKNNSNNLINFYFVIDEIFEEEYLKAFNFIEKIPFCQLKIINESLSIYANIKQNVVFSE